jgi:hypothetical protein
MRHVYARRIATAIAALLALGAVLFAYLRTAL